MNRLFLTAAFLFVLWRVLAPAEPQVPPSLEAAAIRIVHEMTPSGPLARPREGGRKPRLRRAETQGFVANRGGGALVCHNSLVPLLGNVIWAGNACFGR